MGEKGPRKGGSGVGRRRGARSLLLLAGLGAGAAAGELLLRLQEPFTLLMARRYNTSALYVSHAVWDHWPRPSARLTLAVGSGQALFRYSYATNRDGCRHSSDPVLPKPQGLRRILVLGDSFTEGYRLEETGPALLQKRLNSAGGETAWEVINCGCSSYSPLLYYLRFTQQLVHLEPDHVVVNVDLTDIFDDYWRYRPRTRFGADGRPLAVGPAPTSRNRLKEWAKDRLYLARLVSLLRNTLLSRPPSREDGSAPTWENIFRYHFSLPPDSPAWSTEVGFCLENLSRLIRFCRSRDIGITLTTYPHRAQLGPPAGAAPWHREFERRLEELSRREGAAFYSAYEGIRQAHREGSEPLYWEEDMHFTPAGQRIWGELWSAHLAFYLTAGERRPDAGAAQR